MLDEKNTGTNLPAQIDIYAEEGDKYEFLFITKGGGSGNKTYLYQQTKSLLTEEGLTKFVKEKIMDLGTSACPPYHLALVIGGTSAEATLATVKKASAGYYDNLPTEGNEGGQAFRDLEWEAKVEKICHESGVGAQFGGKIFWRTMFVLSVCHATQLLALLVWGLVAAPTGISKQKSQRMVFSLKSWKKIQPVFCHQKRHQFPRQLILIWIVRWRTF